MNHHIEHENGQYSTVANGERITAPTRDDLARLVMQSDRRAEQRRELERRGWWS